VLQVWISSLPISGYGYTIETSENCSKCYGKDMGPNFDAKPATILE